MFIKCVLLYFFYNNALWLHCSTIIGFFSINLFYNKLGNNITIEGTYVTTIKTPNINIKNDSNMARAKGSGSIPVNALPA